MAVVPSNGLVQVQTYNPANLAMLNNYLLTSRLANWKFKNFNTTEVQNKGDTVLVELPLRTYAYTAGLDWTGQAQPVNQRQMSLTVTNSVVIPLAVTAQQYIFNGIEDYMRRQASSIVTEIASEVDFNVLSIGETAPYRFFTGNIDQTDPSVINPLNSATQVYQMLAQDRTFGSTKERLKVVMQDIMYPAIVSSLFQQFVPNRNDKWEAEYMMGSSANADFYQSNLLTTHIAGTVGQSNTELTVVSISPDGTQLTLSGAAINDPDAIALNDSLFILDDSAYSPRRLLTFSGHKTSVNPVQVRATAPAASDGSGNVIVNIFPALVSTANTATRNVNLPIVAGLKVKALGNHRCGFVIAENALFAAMPRLPDKSPFATSIETDPDVGLSMRMYYGTGLEDNFYGFVHDGLYGWNIAPEYIMKIAIPV